MPNRLRKEDSVRTEAEYCERLMSVLRVRGRISPVYPKGELLRTGRYVNRRSLFLQNIIVCDLRF